MQEDPTPEQVEAFGQFKSAVSESTAANIEKSPDVEVTTEEVIRLRKKAEQAGITKEERQIGAHQAALATSMELGDQKRAEEAAKGLRGLIAKLNKRAQSQ